MLSNTLSYYFITLLSIHTAFPLECYVCDNQEDNKGKCINSIQTCPYRQDVCLTEISWGSTPYWQQGALKQYYISKRCSNNDACKKYRSSNMATCTHIWYQDWKCSECCKGDRCNYYVISGASTTISTLWTASLLATVHLVYNFYYN